MNMIRKMCSNAEVRNNALRRQRASSESSSRRRLIWGSMLMENFSSTSQE
jgi:hypothetical protein